MDFVSEIAKKITSNAARIVFPEGNEKTIVQAAGKIVALGVAQPILLGDPQTIKGVAAEAGVDLAGITILDQAKLPAMDAYAAAYSEEHSYPVEVAEIILKKPLYYGAMMVRMGDADSIIAGLVISSDEVVSAFKLIIGMQDDIKTPSSFCVVDAPHYHGQDGSLLLLSAPVINVEPTSEELADIAIASARSAKAVLDWEPRVAMLSFSTRGSAVHPAVTRVADAVEIGRKREPGLKVDGEMQLDAAVFPEVAARKVGDESPVAGRANVLIFPDLNAGNIGTKLFFLTEARGYGTFLQGFKAPVSDLTRSAKAESIVGTAVVLAKCCQR